MFCPTCRSEFREGYRRCTDCDVDLVESIEEVGDPEANLLNVFATADPVLIAIAKSVLDEAGIVFLTKNEVLQDVIAGGRLGAGYNSVLGPVEFWVREDDEVAARELFEELASAVPADIDDADSE